MNGANGYVQVPDNAQWEFNTNAFTIELWANFFITNGQRAMVAHDQGGGVQSKWIFWLDSGFLRFHINGAVGVANIGSAPFTPVSNQWYHLALTRQSSNYTFFINGSAVSTNVDTRAVPDAAASLTLGQAEGNFYFNGLLDEVSIYNRALSPLEIQSVYAAGTAGKCFTLPPGVGVPYFTDFESGVHPAWIDPRWEASQTTYFTRFLGRFDNNSQTLLLTNVTPGQSYTLTFDFYPIDSWDGGGTDFFYVGADGVQLLRDTFSNYNGNPPGSPQTFRSPDEGRAAFGFEPSFVDAIYRSIRLTFVPSNSIALLAFAGQGLQTVRD